MFVTFLRTIFHDKNFSAVNVYTSRAIWQSDTPLCRNTKSLVNAHTHWLLVIYYKCRQKHSVLLVTNVTLEGRGKNLKGFMCACAVHKSNILLEAAPFWPRQSNYPHLRKN